MSHAGDAGLSIDAIGDRLAIINLLGAYAHYANIGDIDGWRGTFAEDATYLVSAPGLPGSALTMAQVVKAETPFFAQYAKVDADPISGERAIYRIANPYIISQNHDTAEIVCQLSIYRTRPDGPPPRIWITGAFSGMLTKACNNWRIQRWAINTTRLPDESWALNPLT